MSSWLTIIGIGEDGLQGLNNKARNAVKRAEIVYGGKRHLALANDDILGEKRQWPKPFLSVINDIKALRGRSVAVLASGNPLFYGVGNTLIENFAPDEIQIYYQPSSFCLALQRLGWPAQDVDCVSLVGRTLNSLKSSIQDRKKIIILPANRDALKNIIQIFEEMDAHKTKLTILENLGGEREKISANLSLCQAKHYDVGDLYIIAAECSCSSLHTYPLGTILPDKHFENDGQFTKHAIRALTLSYLLPHDNQLLWDIGAGCGSIAIEWLRAAPKTRAFAVEKNPQRAKMIQKNADKIGVTGLTLFEGNAVDIVPTLEAPDAIFIGGGFTNDKMIKTCWDSLKTGGRFIANGVTLETETAFQLWIKHYGGELIKFSTAKAEPLGKFHVWRQVLPVTILVATKA